MSYDLLKHTVFKLFSETPFEIQLSKDYAIDDSASFTLNVNLSYSLTLLLSRINTWYVLNKELSMQELNFFYQNFPRFSESFDSVTVLKNSSLSTDYDDVARSNIEQIIESMCISLVFSLIVLVISLLVTKRRETILKLFSTISTEDLEILQSDIQNHIDSQSKVVASIRLNNNKHTNNLMKNDKMDVK